MSSQIYNLSAISIQWNGNPLDIIQSLPVVFTHFREHHSLRSS